MAGQADPRGAEKGGRVMTYSTPVVKAKFLSRPNRFIALVELDGETVTVHVKNTGRLKELLTYGVTCFVQETDNSERKTRYSLIAVQKGEDVVNVDSQAPNKVFYEWAKSGAFIDGISLIRPEKTYGNSRFDCYIEAGNRKIFIEVKGVTLEKEGVALFPDAPTERGVKHLKELCECVKNGYEAYIVFVVQMKGVHTFSPNRETHPKFADALCECEKNGVNILCVDCNVTPETLEISNEITIKL